MSKLAKTLLLTILLVLIGTVTAYLYGIGMGLLVMIVLPLLVRKFNRLVNQLQEDRKIKRMGDYVTAYTIAKNFGETEARVEDWCKQGRVPGAFKRDNLWLIPRDFTIYDMDSSMMEQAEGKF